METALAIRRVVDHPGPCIHAYYDCCPESPDGAQVLAFAFDGCVPGPGRVAVVPREGGRPRFLDDPATGIGHVGRLAMWVDDRLIGCGAGRPDDRLREQAWVLRDLDGRIHARGDGYLRQFHPGRGRGLVMTAAEDGPQDRHHRLHVIDRAGDRLATLAVADVIAAHPCRERLPDPSRLAFINPKWAHEGGQLMVGLISETAAVGEPEVKCLFTWGADGRCPVFVGDYGHHHAWTPSGDAIIAMRRSPRGQDLIRYDPDGHGDDILLAGARGVHGTLSPDGRWLVIDEFGAPDREHVRVIRCELVSGRIEELARFRQRDRDHADGFHPHPAFGRDGSRLYFNAQDDGRTGLYALDWPG